VGCCGDGEWDWSHNLLCSAFHPNPKERDAMKIITWVLAGMGLGLWLYYTSGDMPIWTLWASLGFTLAAAGSFLIQERKRKK